MNAHDIILQVECPGERGEIHLHGIFFLCVCPSFHDGNWPNPKYSNGHDGAKINTCLLKLFFSSLVLTDIKKLTEKYCCEGILLDQTGTYSS